MRCYSGQLVFAGYHIVTWIWFVERRALDKEGSLNVYCVGWDRLTGRIGEALSRTNVEYRKMGKVGSVGLRTPIYVGGWRVLNGGGHKRERQVMKQRSRAVTQYSIFTMH